MFGEEVSVPVGNLIEEVSFNLLAAATRDGPPIGSLDWYGDRQPDFGTNRRFGFPLLDLAIRPPGSVQVILQAAVPTFPIAEPPVLTFTDYKTFGILGGTWGSLSERLLTRFLRVRVLDTSGAANNEIYLVYSVRSQ